MLLLLLCTTFSHPSSIYNFSQLNEDDEKDIIVKTSTCSFLGTDKTRLNLTLTADGLGPYTRLEISVQDKNSASMMSFVGWIEPVGASYEVYYEIDINETSKISYDMELSIESGKAYRQQTSKDITLIEAAAKIFTTPVKPTLIVTDITQNITSEKDGKKQTVTITAHGVGFTPDTVGSIAMAITPKSSISSRQSYILKNVAVSGGTEPTISGTYLRKEYDVRAYQSYLATVSIGSETASAEFMTIGTASVLSFRLALFIILALFI